MRSVGDDGSPAHPLEVRGNLADANSTSLFLRGSPHDRTMLLVDIQFDQCSRVRAGSIALRRVPLLQAIDRRLTTMRLAGGLLAGGLARVLGVRWMDNDNR